MPISLHEENSRYNASLAKRKAKPKNRGFLRIMQAQIVLKRLSEMGVTVTERTLQKYVKAELIPMPFRKSAGRGRGKITDYMDETPAEFYASYRLLHDKNFIKPPPEVVANERKNALKIEGDPVEMLYFHQELDIVRKFTRAGYALGHLFAEEWLKFKARAEVWPVPPGAKIEIIYCISADRSRMTRTINVNDLVEGITVKVE